MPLGLTLLVVVSILILFGVGQRILDRMRLNDKTALLFMVAIFVGGLIPNIPLGRSFSINLGGAVIPLILVIYLFVKADTAKEKSRSILAAILAGAGIYLAGRLMPSEPGTMPFDPNYAYGIIAGVILADIAQGLENVIRNIPAPINIGGAGAVDIVVISGLLAVMLAEFVGELREKLQGGTNKKNMHFDHAEFTSAIGAEDENTVDDKNANKDNNNKEKESENHEENHK